MAKGVGFCGRGEGVETIVSIRFRDIMMELFHVGKFGIFGSRTPPFLTGSGLVSGTNNRVNSAPLGVEHTNRCPGGHRGCAAESHLWVSVPRVLAVQTRSGWGQGLQGRGMDEVRTVVCDIPTYTHTHTHTTHTHVSLMMRESVVYWYSI